MPNFRFNLFAALALSSLCVGDVSAGAASISPLLGDLDNDGRITVADLFQLKNRLDHDTSLDQRREVLADLDENGRVDSSDKLILQSTILGRIAPKSPSLTTVISTSPESGSTDVAVTRETIFRFSRPLSLGTLITPQGLYAEFAGQRLVSRIEMSGDRKAVTLFYAYPLPGSTRVRVTFNGNPVSDILGVPIDADGDGASGGAAIVEFQTLSQTALANNVVCGRVFASELATNAPGQTNMSVNIPLAGVTITADGLEQDVRALTDQFGNFRLTNAPSGQFFVHIDGRTVTNLAGGVWYNPTNPSAYAYYPFVGKQWESTPGREVNIGEVYLPLVSAGTLQPVSATNATTITFAPGVVVDHPDLAGVSLTIPANSLYSNNGNRGGRVGIAPVPPDRMPGPTPQGLEFPIVITVQTDGAENFSSPVPVCFPNLTNTITGEPPLPPGAKSALWSFNHDTGQFEMVGPMTVSADGRLICSDPGVGIRAPGWHGARQGTSGPTCDSSSPLLAGSGAGNDGAIVSGSGCAPNLPCAQRRGPPQPWCENEVPVPEGYELVDNTDAANVYLHSGEFYQTVTDLRIKGRGFDFEWTRKYRSRVCTGSEMGNNWDYSYNIRVTPDGLCLRCRNGTAREDLYRPREADKWIHNGFFREITRDRTTGGTVITFDDQKQWHFVPFDGSAAGGRISRIVDRNGNTMRFQYDGRGYLTNVIDTLDRNIRVQHNYLGYITNITDFAGRSATYKYYGDAEDLAGRLEQQNEPGNPWDLKSATTPKVTGTPNGNNFPTGKTTTYTYSRGSADGRLNSNLLTIRDPRGNIILENTYSTDSLSYEVDRVTRQVWGGDVLRISYSSQEPAPGNGGANAQTRVTDRNGNPRNYFYDVGNRLVRMQEGSHQTSYEYNLDSQVTRITYPNGNFVDYVYEADMNPAAEQRIRGNLRRVVRNAGSHSPAGDQAAITEAYDYEDGFGTAHYSLGPRFVTRFTDGRGHHTDYSYDPKGNRTRITYELHDLPVSQLEENFSYNGFGQVTEHTHRSGSAGRRKDRFEYYRENNPSRGYLQREVVDDGGFALTTAYEYDSVGNVIQQTDPRGNVTRFDVNQLNQIVRKTLPPVGLGNAANYRIDTHFDENNNVVKTTALNFDASGSLVSSNNEWTTTFKYDVLNFLTEQRQEVRPGIEIVTEHTHDAVRNRTETRFGEATAGRQSANRVRWDYDDRNLVRREIRAPGSPDESVTQFEYDGNRNLTRRVSGVGSAAPEITVNSYDGHNRLVRTTDPMGNVARREFDANGNLTRSVVDGELTDVANNAGNVRLSEVNNDYDKLNRLTESRTAYFDPYTALPIGVGVSKARRVYADNSLLVRVEDPRGNNVTNHYDSADRLASVTDSKGNRVANTYDDNGNLKTARSEETSDLGRPTQNFLTSHTYDNLNRLVRTVDSAGNLAQFAYDSRNNQARVTDGNGNVTTFDYDGLNRLLTNTVWLTDNGLGTGSNVSRIVTVQAWDDSSRLLSLTDNNNHTTRYEYDPLDRRTLTRYADGTEHRSTFDVFGNVITQRDANGTVVTNSYDQLNRLTQRIIAPGTNVQRQALGETFAYDGLSRMVRAQSSLALVTFQHNSLGLPTVETFTAAGQRGTNFMSYDLAGNLTNLIYPSGYSLGISYDALNQKSEIENDGSLIARYRYVGPGRVERRTFGSGAFTEFKYDGIQGEENPLGDSGVKRTVEINHQFPGLITPRSVDHRRFTWDAAGNKKSRVDVSSETTNRYSYDSAYRMTRSLRSSGMEPPRTNLYVFDGVGNRLQTEAQGVTNYYALTNASPEPADAQVNQYTSTPFDARAYDRNGNLAATTNTVSGSTNGTNTVRGAIYNYRNQLVEMDGVSLGVRVTFASDALGRRFRKSVSTAVGNQTNTVTTRFFCSGNQVLEERDGTNALQARYVFGRGVNEVLTMRRGGQTYYYHSDDLGNVMALSDENGDVVERYDYEDYGAPIIFDGSTNLLAQSAVLNPHLFSGHRYEPETGLLYCRARYLDLQAGRFVQRDPKGYVDGPNLFAYVGNSPWSRVDLMGTEEDEPQGSTRVQVSSEIDARQFVDFTASQDPSAGQSATETLPVDLRMDYHNALWNPSSDAAVAYKQAAKAEFGIALTTPGEAANQIPYLFPGASTGAALDAFADGKATLGDVGRTLALEVGGFALGAGFGKLVGAIISDVAAVERVAIAQSAIAEANNTASRGALQLKAALNDTSLAGTRLLSAPTFNPSLVSSLGITRGQRLTASIEIGPYALSSRANTVQTIVHEEMHVRLDLRSARGSNRALRTQSNLDVEENYVEAVARRFWDLKSRR